MNSTTQSPRGLRSQSTLDEYRTTKKYLKNWGYKIGSFADWLASQPKLTPATQAKHLRQAKTLAKENGKPWNLGNPPIIVQTPPPIFSDSDFQTLYQAFENTPYPSFILPEYRSLYWQTLIHFASVTALRRQAIFGIELTAINFNENYLTISPDIDKKHQVRYKPITPELASDILELLRHYDKTKIHPAQYNRLFPWKHGDKCWYSIWHLAEKAVGKRFHLHDLKRFSGELALRAGATPLELQQHMDHSNLTTTLRYYARPQTKNLIAKIKVPIPDRQNKITPLFGEGQLKEILTSIITDKLADLGIDTLVSLDKFGIPTNITHQEIRNSNIGFPKEKKPAKPQKSSKQPLLPQMQNKEGKMIKTLAKIASHTAKGIYAFLVLQGGASSRKEPSKQDTLQALFTRQSSHSKQQGSSSKSAVCTKSQVPARRNFLKVPVRRKILPARRNLRISQSKWKVPVYGNFPKNLLTLLTC